MDDGKVRQMAATVGTLMGLSDRPKEIAEELLNVLAVSQQWQPEELAMLRSIVLPNSVRPTVQEAAHRFFSLCGSSEPIWERMEAFLRNLRTDPRWTTSELDEVQALIIECQSAG